MSQSTTQQKRLRIKRKIRATLSGTTERPRLTVSRTNQFIHAQLIDDVKAVTIASASDMVKKGSKKIGTKMEGAIAAGKVLAEKAKALGITAIVFDRNGFKYSGRIKAFADAVRGAGLIF